MKKIACILVTISFLSAASLVHAADIVQTDTFSNESINSAMTIPLTFNSFNSSLGTLDQVDYAFTGTLNVTGTTTRSGAYNITLNLPYRLEAAGMQQLDARTITTNLTGSGPTGTTLSGPYSFSFQVDNLADNPPTSLYFPSALQNNHTGSNGLSINLNTESISGTFQLTYDYTAAPEPSTWALLLVGFGLLVLFYRPKPSVC
jgi:hypothetical protein